jgi:hypothetical protein
MFLANYSGGKPQSEMIALLKNNDKVDGFLTVRRHSPSIWPRTGMSSGCELAPNPIEVVEEAVGDGRRSC